jgi:hypothetical protein
MGMADLCVGTDCCSANRPLKAYTWVSLLHGGLQMSPRGIAGSGPGASARSGTTATIDSPTTTTAASSPATTGVIWKSATYRFLQQPTGLIIEMEATGGWMPVSNVPVSVVEQFLTTRGLLKPMVGTLPVHATNGAARNTRATRARTARSGTGNGTRTARANKTTTVSSV